MSELVLPNIKAQIDQLYLRKRFVSFGIPSIIVLYLIYIIITFDVINVAKSASATNARTLIGDSYSYKTHVRRDNRSSDISIKIEGEKKTLDEIKSKTKLDGKIVRFLTVKYKNLDLKTEYFSKNKN